MRKLILISLVLAGIAQAHDHNDQVVMKLKAKNKQERNLIVNEGINIEGVDGDVVTAFGRMEQAEKMQADGKLLSVQSLREFVRDFPLSDAAFHNYDEMVVELNKLHAANPNNTELFSMGKTLEGREMLGIRIGNADPSTPAVLFMGGHHAREHLSIEMPIMLAQRLLKQYAEGDATVTTLLNTRQIWIMPMTNPDGAEFDISTGNYKWWRKNRRKNVDGSFGVDLNRNYGYKWGGEGASANPKDETFRGTAAFSEPETQNVKNFIESHPNISILLSFHTFSQLILYPWGYTDSSITVQSDMQVFTTMAESMAQWNKYTPQQSSDLYVTSGDTTDWAYGEHGIFAFTFELDPKSIFGGGFYPGAGVIQNVFEKNVKPCMYLIDLADNPYRATEKTHQSFGLETPIF